MYLECAECGRETSGWIVTSNETTRARRGLLARSWTEVWRDFWSQARRDPFPAVDLR